MEKMHIRFMKDLRNIEFEELFDLIYTTVEAEKIDTPSITTAIERIELHRKELLRMNYKKLRHPLTQIIREKVNSRTEYLACLRLTVDAKMLSHIPAERIAAKSLLLWLSPYKKNIYAPTIHRQSRMVKDLMEDRKQSTEIKQATALLGLEELLEEIVKINAKIEHNYLKRLNEKEIYIVKGSSIRNAAYKDLKLLVNVLELSHNLSSDNEQKEQLEQLSMLINENLKDFRTLVRTRTTKRKKKRDVESAVKELIHDSQLINKEIGTNNLPMVIDNQLDTSASSGSKLQSSINSNSNNIQDIREEEEDDRSDEKEKDGKTSNSKGGPVCPPSTIIKA